MFSVLFCFFYKARSSSTGTDRSWVRILGSSSVSSGVPSADAVSVSCSGEGLPSSSDSPPGRLSRPGSTDKSPFPRPTSNRVRPAEVESGTGLQAAWGSWAVGVAPLYMGLRVSKLSGVSVFAMVGLTELSNVWGEGAAAAAAASGAEQYGGEEPMKFTEGCVR